MLPSYVELALFPLLSTLCPLRTSQPLLNPPLLGEETVTSSISERPLPLAGGRLGWGCLLQTSRRIIHPIQDPLFRSKIARELVAGQRNHLV